MQIIRKKHAPARVVIAGGFSCSIKSTLSPLGKSLKGCGPTKPNNSKTQQTNKKMLLLIELEN